MRRLIGSIIVLWVLLAAACAVVLVVGRSAGANSEMQALGLADCGGTLCYKSLHLGDSWAKVKTLFPQATPRGHAMQFSSHDGGNYDMYFVPSKDNATVQTIDITASSFDDGLPLDVGTVIAWFGSPCNAALEYGDGALSSMQLTYPGLDVRVKVTAGTEDNPQPSQLTLSSPVFEFLSTSNPTGNEGTCSKQTSMFSGPWYGFASLDTYRSRYSSAP